MMPVGAGHSHITGDEGCIESLGEREVHRIVCRCRIPHFPCPFEEGTVGIPGQGEVGQVRESLASPLSGQLAPDREPAEYLCRLDVKEVRSARQFSGIKETFAAALSNGRPQQHLHHGGRVDDDHRAFRSLRRASVGDSESVGRLRLARRC